MLSRPHITPHKVLAHVDRLAAWKRGEKPAPVTVEWDLSNRCPLGCQSCHFAHTHTRGPWASRDRLLPMAWEGVGDLADTSLVVRGLQSMAAAGVLGVVWSGGGEPTLHPDWLRILAEADGLGLRNGMYTAGVMLAEKSAQELARLAQWVVVSLDCADAETYRKEKGVPHFERACAGIAWLAGAKSAKVSASFLLHGDNWLRAPDMVSLARALGATTVFRPTIDTSPDRPSVCASDRGWVSEALPVLTALADEPDVVCDPSRFEAYRDWNGRDYTACHGIKLNATITPDGRVWVCPQRRGMAQGLIGDLRVESFETIWQRHPGQWTDFADCRVMCRLHLDNQVLAPIYASHAHEAFV